MEDRNALYTTLAQHVRNLRDGLMNRALFILHPITVPGEINCGVYLAVTRRLNRIEGGVAMPIDGIEALNRSIALAEERPVGGNGGRAVIGCVGLIVKVITGLVIALHRDNATARGEVASDKRANRVEPLANRLVEFRAGVGRHGVWTRRMEAPCRVDVKASQGGMRLNFRVEQDPFRITKIRHLGINQWPWPHHQIETARFTKLAKGIKIFARVSCSPIEHARRGFMNRPGDIGFDHPEAQRAHPVKNQRPQLTFKPPIVDGARIDRNMLAVNVETPFSQRNSHRNPNLSLRQPLSQIRFAARLADK